MTRTLWRLGGYVLVQRRLLAASFLCMAVLGLATGAYAWLLGPALRFLLTGGAGGLGLPGWLGPELTQIDRTRALWVLPLLVVGLGVVKGLGYLGQFYGMGLVGQRVMLAVRRALFERLSTLSPARLSAQLSGDLLSRFGADVAAIEAAATYGVASYLRDGLQIAILAGVALARDPKLAALALAAVPLAIVPAARLTRSLLGRTREGQAQLGALAAQVAEGLGGLSTLQAFNAEASEMKRFHASARIHRRAMVQAGWMRGAVPGLMEILAAGALAAALAYAGGARRVSPEGLVSLLACVVLMYQPAKDLGKASQLVLQAGVAAERIFEVLDWQHPVPSGVSRRSPVSLSRGISFEKVTYAYGDRRALEGLSLEVPVGQVTALVGPSGGGKSTVTSLLLRFDKPAAGRILLDGADVAGLDPRDVREQFALVTQQPMLFAASVLDNLKLGRPAATREQVEAAARVADADAFIRALPQGYDTPLGERGARLSGGQRQRLCLARAVLSGAPVLVLDEATSSLDPEGEREVQQALAEVLRGRTALVIAHRLSTVAGSDRIHVLANGRIVESGTHPELLAARGAYARLWMLQQTENKQVSVA